MSRPDLVEYPHPERRGRPETHINRSPTRFRDIAAATPLCVSRWAGLPARGCVDRSTQIRSYPRSRGPQDLRAGKIRLEQILATPADYLANAEVFDLLVAVPENRPGQDPRRALRAAANLPRRTP
jgi:hypothetical protein